MRWARRRILSGFGVWRRRSANIRSRSWCRSSHANASPRFISHPSYQGFAAGPATPDGPIPRTPPAQPGPAGLLVAGPRQLCPSRSISGHSYAALPGQTGLSSRPGGPRLLVNDVGAGYQCGRHSLQHDRTIDNALANIRPAG